MKSFYVVIQMKVLVHQVKDERDARNHALEVMREFVEKSKRVAVITDVTDLSVLSASVISGPFDDQA